MAEVIKIFESNGVAIGLIVVGCLFAYFKFWPWWIARDAADIQERKERHEEYLETQRNMTTALNRLGDITESFVLSLESHDKNSARNYAEIMARLEKLRGKDTGPLLHKQSGS